jgi:hypothetical protein
MKIILLALFALAFAQKRHFEACAPDREAFCSDVTDRHAMRKCMHDHWEQLSEPCQTAITEFMQARHDRIKAACANDEDTLCADSKADERTLRQCMRSNWASVSQPCRDAVADFHQPHPHHDDPDQKTDTQETQTQTQTQTETETEEHPCPMRQCEQDVQTFCPEVDSMEAAHECIKTNWESLSLECRSAVEEFLKAQAQSNESTGGQFETGDVVEHGVGDPTVTNGMASVSRATAEPVWQFWLQRLWWTYPVGLVLIIQIVASFRIRNIRRMEAQA